jgi:rubrerythrin
MEVNMTVQSDLQKAIASCEAAKGSYAMMAQSTEDPQAKQMFNSMKADIDRHIQYLNGRLSYLNQNNDLNKKKQ